MTEPDETTLLRRALADAQQRLQDVAEVSGGALGTLEFELRGDDDLIFVRADEAAGRLITVANAAFYGRKLPEVFTSIVGPELPEALRDTARHGRALPPRSFVPAGTRLGRAFSMFAFQPAADRVVIKFWESSGLEETQEIARRNQELLSQIFENSPVAIALTREPDGSIVDVNAAWSRLSGYSRREALGRTESELGAWADPTKRDSTAGRVDGLGPMQNPELPLRTRDGRPIVVSMIGSHIEIAGVRHHLVYLLDVTARKSAEDALRELNAELESRVATRTTELAQARDEAERASRVKSDFLSGMSHELRTPLNAILGFGQLLQSDPAHVLPERQNRYVKEILRAGAHLLDLINDVLDLARIEAGRLQISLEPVHVGALIDDCLALLRPVALEHRIALSAATPAACDHHVSADRTRAKQVLLNLLSNAIKYNHEGGSVRIGCVPDGEGLRIEVIDTGPGLSHEQQQRLFQDFERLDADRAATPGTGIGLALSRRLVQMMRGAIGVKSQVGVGSTFWFRLQLAKPAQSPAHAVAPRSAAERGTPAHGAVPDAQYRVLYIEDNPANALLLEEALRHRRDIRVIHAQLPGLGLELARAERPDLILLDIQLPGMDGYEVLRRLRASDATRDTPAVAISANAMRADIERGLAAGFSRYLTKPLDVRQFLAVVDELLRD